MSTTGWNSSACWRRAGSCLGEPPQPVRAHLHVGDLVGQHPVLAELEERVAGQVAELLHRREHVDGETFEGPVHAGQAQHRVVRCRPPRTAPCSRRTRRSRSPSTRPSFTEISTWRASSQHWRAMSSLSANGAVSALAPSPWTSGSPSTCGRRPRGPGSRRRRCRASARGPRRRRRWRLGGEAVGGPRGSARRRATAAAPWVVDAVAHRDRVEALVAGELRRRGRTGASADRAACGDADRARSGDAAGRHHQRLEPGLVARRPLDVVGASRSATGSASRRRASPSNSSWRTNFERADRGGVGDRRVLLRWYV